MTFEEWHRTKWVEHVEGYGSIRGQLKLLTWMVGALLTSNLALVAFLLKLATDV